MAGPSTPNSSPADLSLYPKTDSSASRDAFLQRFHLAGLQKVVQAAGRVIRSETDTGTVILLDARYRERKYRTLLPAWWRLGRILLFDCPQPWLCQAPRGA